MADPIAQRLPATLPSFVQKWQNIDTSNLDPDAISAVSQLDLSRVQKGQSPLSPFDTAAAYSAARTKQAVAKPAEPNILEGFGRDIQDLVSGFPKLPGQLLNEAQNLGQPVPGAQNILQQRGFRMLPGAFTLGNIMSGNVGQLAQHPLFTAMDVLPAVSQGFKLLPAEAQAPIREAMSSRVGQPLGALADRFGLGPVTQDVSRQVAVANRRLGNAYNAYAEEVSGLTKGMSDPEIANLTDVMGRGNPQEMATLPRQHVEAMGKLGALNQRFFTNMEAEGLMKQFNGEWYPTSQADRLEQLQSQLVDQPQTPEDVANNERLIAEGKKIVPARFAPLMREKMTSAVLDLAQKRNPDLVGTAFDHVANHIKNGFYDLAPNVAEKDLTQLATEVNQTWSNLRAAGHDPVLLHEAPARGSTGQDLSSPRVNPEKVPAMGTARPRDTYNYTPYFKDFQVGLNKSGLEELQRQMSQEVHVKLQSTYGRNRNDVIQELIPQAEQYATTRGRDLRGVVNTMLDRDWKAWDGRGFTNASVVTDPDAVLVPRVVAKTLNDIRKTSVASGGFKQTFDTAMGVFRTSILPLSPRWHVNNAIGGTLLTAAKTGPSILQHLGEAWEMAKSGKMPEGISQGFVSVPEEVRAWNTEAGRNIGKLIKDKEPELLQRYSRLGGKFSKITDLSYHYQQILDNFFRASAYLYGKGKGIEKGLSAAEAEAKGLKLANSVLQDWDAMTPLERSVIRNVIPFYGWSKHILTYVSKYPWDHPLRASIYANIARNEALDWPTGLPEQFKNYISVGGKDKQGNQQAINIAGANPFRDVGNMFTLGGFLGSMNPFVTGFAKALGVDFTGHSQLYPQVSYDAKTGRLVPQQPNLFSSIAGQFVPQVQGIQALMGNNKRLNDLKQSNPDAWQAYITSSLGIPFVPRNYNPQTEAAKSELQRQQAVKTALTEAIKTGNYDYASRFPQLRPLLATVEKAQQAGAFKAYNAQSINPTAVMQAAGLAP